MKGRTHKRGDRQFRPMKGRRPVFPEPDYSIKEQLIQTLAERGWCEGCSQRVDVPEAHFLVCYYAR